MGRVHKRLLGLLSEAGFCAIEITAARGHWRSSPYADVHRWEGSAVRSGEHVRRSIYSWDTMTDCVKNGIEVSVVNGGCSGNGYEISSRRAT